MPAAAMRRLQASPTKSSRRCGCRASSDAHVAGNSLGGWLSIELARRGFARSVTAFSPAGGWRTDEDYRAVSTPFRIFYALVGVILFVTRLFAGAAWLRKALTRQMMEHGERLAAADFLGMLRAMAKTRVLRGLLRTMARDGPVAPLDAGSVPIRIAWGGCDAVIPYPRYGEPFVERIHGAEATTVPGVGHVPMYDDPARIVANILDVTSRVDAPTREPVRGDHRNDLARPARCCARASAMRTPCSRPSAFAASSRCWPNG